MTPNSATLGGFRVKTIGSNKRFEIHVYNHDKIELRKINASVEEESERSGATSVQNIQKDESIEITYSFTDNRSEEQKREDAEDTAE